MLRIVGYLILLQGLIWGCNSSEISLEPHPIRPVQVLEVSTLENIQQQYPGIVVASEQSNLAFRLSGKMVKLQVTTGQQVAAGDVIAQLQANDYQLQYETAQKNYQIAQTIYERDQRLWAVNAIATQEVEIAKTNYAQAEEALQVAQNRWQQTVLKAPYSGFIEKTYVEPFDEIQAGETIVRLINPETLEIHFILPETAFQLLEFPQKIQIAFDRIAGKRFTAELKEYISVSDGIGIPVVLQINDEQFISYRHLILPGFSCQIIWEAPQSHSGHFVIPASAVQKRYNKEFLWLIDPKTSTVYLQEIKTVYINQQLFVQSGLKVHDLIVTAGGDHLREGQKVRINQ